MEATILHSGFDGLKFTIQADIPDGLREELISAKQHAKETFSDCALKFDSVSLNVTSKGARGFTAHTGDHGAVWLFQDRKTAFPTTPVSLSTFAPLALLQAALKELSSTFATAWKQGPSGCDLTD